MAKNLLGDQRLRSIRAMFQAGAMKAKKHLETIVDSRVLLQVPEIGIVSAASLKHLEDEVAKERLAVQVPISGDLEGIGAILLEKSSGSALCAALPLNEKSGKNHENFILKLLAKLIIESVTTEVASSMNASVAFGNYAVLSDAPADAGLSSDAPQRAIIVVGESNFAFATQAFAGEILILIRIDSVQAFLERLEG